MDRRSPTAAAGVPFRWTDVKMIPGEVDRSYQRGAVEPSVEPGLPANGQVFTAASDLHAQRMPRLDTRP
jgi:hypothetical protein